MAPVGNSNPVSNLDAETLTLLTRSLKAGVALVQIEDWQILFENANFFSWFPPGSDADEPLSERIPGFNEERARSRIENGRPYSLIMLVGMAALYFFIKHLQTLERRFLIPAAFFFATLFYASYSSIQFIVLSQILWFYGPRENNRKPAFSSFLLLNGIIFTLCLPWLLFVLLVFKKTA